MIRRDIPPRTKMTVGSLLERGIPKSYMEYRLRDYTANEQAYNFFRNYLANLHDSYENFQNLILWGNNGSGKTMIASLIVKEAYRLRYNAYMTTLANLMDLKFNPRKTEEDFEKINKLKTAEFLVIDEVGKENFTSTGSNINILEETLRNSIKMGQVVILCTNLSLKDIEEQYGSSISSIIQGADFQRLGMAVAEDYRTQVKNGKKIIPKRVSR